MRDAIDALEVFEVILPPPLLLYLSNSLVNGVEIFHHPAPMFMMQHVRDVTDPEHPYTLEQLKVVSEDAITVKDKEGIVRCAQLEL